MYLYVCLQDYEMEILLNNKTNKPSMEFAVFVVACRC